MAPIDVVISSDDSSEDSELRAIDEYKDESPTGDSASSDFRALPAWASGHSRPSAKDPTPKRTAIANGSSVNFNGVNASSLVRPSYGDRFGASSSRASADDRNDHDKNSSQQTLKRMLPGSFYSSGPFSRPSLVENVGSSQIRQTQEKSYQSAWSTPKDAGAIHMKDHSSRGIGALYTGVNDPLHHPGMGDERAAGTDERLIYQAALQDLNQPKVEATLPAGLLSVSLLRHQRIALAWMLQKETSSVHCLGGILADDQGLGKTVSMIAIIQTQRSSQEKAKSKNVGVMKAQALNLDDDDENTGTTSQEPKQSAEPDDFQVIPEASTMKGFRRKRPAAGTLVVCPASILRQWARELDEKVTNEAKLDVLIYHGGNRPRDPVELAKYDVVITTYAIVTNEVPKQPVVEDDDDEQKNGERYGLSSQFSNYKKQKNTYVKKKGKKGRNGIDTDDFDPGCGTLARVSWFRVILDEAQTIKNHRTQVARACCSLRAKRRWCLSGTPIQNSIDELFSYFRFLRYDPYADFKTFCSGVKYPIAMNSIQGYKKLQAILRAIMLRRTKGTLIEGQPIINLPPKTIHLKKVAFSAEERAFYNRLEAVSRSQFKAYAAAGTVRQNYANILLMLLRLRQACDHPQLVKGQSSDSVKRTSTEEVKKLPKETLKSLLKLLETSPLCQVCRDPPENAVVTLCRHVFCYQCVSEYLSGEDNSCPAHGCKKQLHPDIVFSEAVLKRCTSDNPDNDPLNLSVYDDKSIMGKKYCSSKIRACLEILNSFCKSEDSSSDSDILVQSNGETSSIENKNSVPHTEGPIKAIVFSQWTGMLDLVERSLNQSGIPYERLDGTMTLGARDRAVKEFNTNPKVTVMLMSLKAGNLGLNMVAACHVILLDLWWNPTTEDQAIDRAHRIGQTRPVTVSRLTIQDTVEDRILALQEDKRTMVASAFGEDHAGGTASRLTVEDLRYLFRL
nr:helicase-like transcription factor CHR28 isoform X1 [Ipomoea batatas]